MERNIIDGSHSKDSMEIMDKLMQEELNQEEVIMRTSESDNNEEDNCGNSCYDCFLMLTA